MLCHPIAIFGQGWISGAWLLGGVTAGLCFTIFLSHYSAYCSLVVHVADDGSSITDDMCDENFPCYTVHRVFHCVTSCPAFNEILKLSIQRDIPSW